MVFAIWVLAATLSGLCQYFVLGAEFYFLSYRRGAVGHCVKREVQNDANIDHSAGAYSRHGALFVCLMTLGMGHSLFFAIFPPLARDLGLSEVQASAIFTLSAVLWVLMSPFWGRAAMFGAASRLFCWAGRLWHINRRARRFAGHWSARLATLMTLYALMILIRSIFGFSVPAPLSGASLYR